MKNNIKKQIIKEITDILIKINDYKVLTNIYHLIKKIESL